MRRLPLADCCYGAAILTLPLVGVGLVHWLTGVDTGAGFQPAYLLLAVAWILRIGDILRPEGRADVRRLLALPAIRRGLVWGAVAGGAVLLSAIGLSVAPAPLLAQEAWPRFLRQTLQLAIMVAFLVYPAMWTRGPRRWAWTLGLLAWATVGQLVVATLLAAHQVVPLPGVDIVDGVATSNPAILAGSDRLYLGGFTAIPRWRGTMSEPLYLGSFLLAMIPLLTLRSRPILVIMAVVALVLTWSRGAWLASAAGLAIWWLLRRRAGLPGPSRRWLVAVAATIVAGLALLAAVAGPDAVLLPVRRVAQTLDRGDWSNLTRFYSFQAAWRCFLESPLVGVGWGQFPYHFYDVVDLQGLESQFTWPVVNSVPLLVLCETGLVGFAVLAAAAAAMGRATWRSLAVVKDPDRAARLAALAAAGVGLWLHLLVFSQYNLPHLWVVPGLWLAALIAERGRS